MAVTYGDSQGDGVGTLTRDGSENVDGALSPLTPIALPYTIAPDRRATVFHHLDPSIEVYRGGIDATGDLLIAADVYSNQPGIYTWLRRAGTLGSTAALMGTWHVVVFGKSGGDSTCLVGRMIFDGAGTVAADVDWQNQGGTLTAGGPAPRIP